MRRTTNGGLLILVLLLSLVTGAQAYGSTVPADINHNGNGTYNHNAFSIRSPTRNGGVQSISNANAGGVTSSRNALCKRARLCHTRQVTFTGP
jgi:hypothetical protein